MMRRIAIMFCLFSPALQLGCRKDAETLQTEETIIAGEAVAKEDWQRLLADGWGRRVGDGLGLWVSVARQRLAGIQRGRVRFVHVCSTAARGTGNRQDSHRTPLGWHVVAERFGDGLPPGAIFRERRYTGQVWRPEDKTGKDLILSRILWLRGLEPGVNQGSGIDSHDRYIYIHGTPAEEKLGSPASMGCIRLSNRDIIRLYDETESGTVVLISEW